eukprot:6830761-Alexandrium_andersonii.AAC.1
MAVAPERPPQAAGPRSPEAVVSTAAAAARGPRPCWFAPTRGGAGARRPASGRAGEWCRGS